jgi:hypothetical protein
MTKIAYCQSTWREDFNDTILCISRVSPHVDFTVIAYDGSLTDEQIHWLTVNSDSYRLHPVQFKWTDDMPAMRNAYLEEAKRLGATWCVVSDPDELFSEDLAKNLRRLIEENDTLGYNLLPVHARDQFDNVEWLDELDLLKETPGGYRETGFWKPLLIFKIYPDTHYEGVGVEKNVHEMLRSSTPWNPKNLPKEYYYTHRKSALRIWRNAARNMFIGGGGDNVGDLNPYWRELREICYSHKIDTWPDFEEQVKTGFEDPRFKHWLFEALQAPPTNWGTETRETCKWYFTFHKDQITPEIRERLETPPKMTPEIELENFVTRCYFQVLGRHPDEEGKHGYMEAILTGRITKEQLPQLLMQSPEYRQKVLGAPAGPVERVKMQVPVSVDVHISEELFLEALKRSDTYWKTIKPKMDVGSFILDSLRRRDEFLRWFYANKEGLTIQGLVDWIEDNAPKPDSVALCIMGYHKVLPKILESISVMSPYVDEIHVQGDDFDEEDITYLEAKGASVHIELWRDEFSDYKNKCIAPANTEWVLILDDDEIPTRELAERLHEIVKKSNSGRNYNIVSFDVVDMETLKGEVVSERRSPGGKPLLHWNVPEPYYGNPHIWLKPSYYPWRTVHAPYAYKHMKERGTELPRSVRNVFLGGGGDNTREGNPLWVELRTLTRELNIDTWKEFDGYLKKGGIDPRLLDILKKLAEMPWKDSELQDPLKYYQQLHPEEEL